MFKSTLGHIGRLVAKFERGMAPARWVLICALLGLAGCGSGGGGGSSMSSPSISARVVSFPSGGVPPGLLISGYNTAASVVVRDPTSTAAISNATVSVNGQPLTYTASNQDYEGQLLVAPGQTVTLTIVVSGASYTASGAQFGVYPTIIAPQSGAIWTTQALNLVAWSGVTPSPNSQYALGVLDPSTGQLVWPQPGAFEVIPNSTTSFGLSAGSVSAGSLMILAGIVMPVTIAHAGPQSSLLIGGFNYVPITVTNGPPPPSLASIAITPGKPTIGQGKTTQLTATGTYSDATTRDLTTQVVWTSLTPTEVTVNATGLATGVNFGTATITASLSGISGSAAVTVFHPTPSPIPPLSQAVAYQIDYAHSGFGTFGTPITFPAAPTWSVALAGEISYPLIAGGKVFVTTTTPGTTASPYGTYLYALDKVTGAIVWGPVPLSGTYFWSGHAYDNGKIFVVNYDGLLKSFDANTGQAGWAVQLPNQYAFSSPPTAVNGIVYVGGAGNGGTLYAVDESDGAILWTAGVLNGDNSSPAVSSDGVFVSYACQQVYKFDPISGLPLWHYSGVCEGGGGSTPAYANGQLYVRDVVSTPPDRIFSAATGAPGPSFSATPIPALTAQTGYFLNAGTLTANDLTSNQALWSFTGDGLLVSAPIVIDQVVIIASSSGNVYALDAGTGSLLWQAAAGASIAAPDEVNVTAPLTGLGAGEGYLVVPASSLLTAWHLAGP